MIEVVTNWINALVLWLDTLPPGVFAILAGMAIGAMATQWLKRTFPPHVLLGISHPYAASTLIRVIAFALTATPTYFLWPDGLYGATWGALFSGFATPTLYRGVTFFLYRKFPKLEERLSGTAGTV